MKTMLAAAALASAVSLTAAGPAKVALENARVRVYRTTAGSRAGVAHAPGVVVWIEDGPAGKAGRAVWVDDAAVVTPDGPGTGQVAIVQPLAAARDAAPPAAGTQPGESPFTGMSFKPLFDNVRVTVIRARMDVGAREAFH